MRSKNKSNLAPFFVYLNFLNNLKTIVAEDFMTPHGSRFATTVAIVSPLSLKGRAMAPKALRLLRKKIKNPKTHRGYCDLLAFGAIRYQTKFALANLMRSKFNS